MIREPIRDRLRSLEGREILGLFGIAVLLIGGAVFWYVRSLPSAVHVSAIPAAPPAGQIGASPSPSPTSVVVYVSGWVRHPGVYEFRSGDRIVDAIKRAGGPKKGADMNALNLAAFLTDAQQVLVLRKGQAPPPGASGSTGGSGSSSATRGVAAEAPVNLNTATLDQLESLPGIGPALGQRIIDYREQHGPFRTVDDLLEVSGIGDKRLADLRDKVSV